MRLFRRKGTLNHYMIAANGSLLSGDVAMTPRMVERLKELSPYSVIALEVTEKR